MLVDEIILAFPLLTSVVGEKWLRQNLWYEEFISLRLEWYEQLERNLRSLDSRIGLQSLRKCYGSMLRDRKSILTTLYEINGVSLVGLASTSLEIHVRRDDSSSRNFDAKACIKGTELNIECKTRKDDFPFKMPTILEGPERIPIHSGSRSTLDPMMRQTWVWVLITRKAILRSKQFRQVQKYGRSCPKVSHNFPLRDAI